MPLRNGGTLCGSENESWQVKEEQNTLAWTHEAKERNETMKSISSCITFSRRPELDNHKQQPHQLILRYTWFPGEAAHHNSVGLTGNIIEAQRYL